MTNIMAEAAAHRLAVSADETELLSFVIDKQVFGLHLVMIENVLDRRPITLVPLAPPEIAGALNLRGRIVTAFDVRQRLGLQPLPPDAPHMSIVVNHDGELFSLIVDTVGDVLRMPQDRLEDNPVNMDPR